MNSPAICTDDGTQRVDFRGKLSVPMAPRAGDVNLDGAVSITDVTSLIDLLLSGSNSVSMSGDVNLDGSVTISDVTALIDMLLSGETDYTYGKALYDLNEIYKSMRTVGWTTTLNFHQSFGISAYNLMAEVMGDDMIMGALGSGWFWYDAAYNVKTRYTSSSWRSYDLWIAYYTWIANANYILEAAKSLTGTEGNYVKGQAYAIRAYSYFMLAQSFARTYKGHESDLCVPLFTGLTFNGTTGQARSTVSQVYAQIDADINQATSLLNGTAQMVPDHIGYAVAMGLKARIALVKEDWSTAYNSAVAAITASGKTIQDVDAFRGLNNAYAGNVMWGADIHPDEETSYGSFWSHMRTDMPYGSTAPKQISYWLYNKMSATDARLAWWKDNQTGYGSDAKVQDKFNVVDGTEWGGDYIWMRVEEMYLTAAEAACRLNQTTNACNYLNQLMAKRDANYNCTKTGKELGTLTTDETGSLLEEILIQRRIELWGEDGRIYTIRRLRQGFERTTENGWPAELQLTGKALYNPDSYAWVLTIPASEFTGNPNMNPDFLPVGDQNPLGDVTGVGQNVSFETMSSSMTTARTDFYYDVTLTRASTQGEYTTTIDFSTAYDCLSAPATVTFANGSNTAKIQISCNPLQLGQTYSGTLYLSSYDRDCYTSVGQITAHTFTINCQNGNPDGQEISFEQSSLVQSASSNYTSVPIFLTRAITEGEYTATLAISNNQSNVSLGSTSVSFADGVDRAYVWLNFNNLEIGQTYGCVLSLSPQDAATGGAITTMQVSVIRENWIDLGWGNYESGLFSQTVDVYFCQDGGTNKYKMKEPFDYNHDIIFTIDSNNKVYIQPQPCYTSSNLGVITMMGYANEDDSGYAGTYNPATKTATLQMRYYCDAGTWPIQQESFTMP
ncbi:MAG: RagB/SusD family nutrient uptake outer membrane protein [Muribaculaceae bacterium]|nr:RagB/SusD family nutrient uptake outer membrane protein [Muribaculaceae bacterium]